MDNESRKNESKSNRKYILDNPIKPSSKVFFINNELVKLIHINRPNDICKFYNFIQEKEQSMIYSDFKKHRKKAYKVIDTARIFKRSKMQLERWIEKELISPPIGATQGGKRTFRRLSYYSEDDLFTIRSVLATIHIGRPRKDGFVNPSKDIPTEKELRSFIGDAIMLYTKTKDGEFIPVWAEETW